MKSILPLRYEVVSEGADSCRIVGQKTHIASLVKREDAEFIVEACNSYSRLIKELAEAKELIEVIEEYLQKKNEKDLKGLPSLKGPEENIVTCIITENNTFIQEEANI